MKAGYEGESEMWHDCVDGENGEGRGRREYGHGGMAEYTDQGVPYSAKETRRNAPVM